MVGLCQDSVRTSVRTAKCALGATYHVTVFGGYSLVNLVHVLGHVDPKCRLEIHKSVALPLAAHRPSIRLFASSSMRHPPASERIVVKLRQ